MVSCKILTVLLLFKNNSPRIRVSLAKVVELPAVYVEIHYTTPLDQIDLNQGVVYVKKQRNK